MKVQDIPITSLIPQRPPFVMVDKVVRCDDVEATTEFTVREDNVLSDKGILSAAGMLENMAQSCAAKMGCTNKLHNTPIKIGVIGDVRNFVIMRQPHCNETLVTHVQVIENFLNFTLAEIITKVGGKIIATARMKIAETDVVADLT